VPPYDGVAVDLGGGSQGEAGRGGVPTSAGDAKGGVEQTPNAPPSALPDGDSASRHASSCSARGAGTHGTGSLALWASLLTLAAAMLLTRRRK
jgi:hypothetical protein